VIVSDSPAAHNLSGQSKKVGCICPHYFRETNSQYLSESRKIVYMGHRCYILMKHPFRSMKDKFNGNTEKIDGTKLLNRAGTSKKETRSNKAHLSS
jgi:hypothetical protein